MTIREVLQALYLAQITVQEAEQMLDLIIRRDYVLKIVEA
jgi:hypothetical protein